MDRNFPAVGKRTFLTGIIVFAALIFMWRVLVFGDLEPRGDQAFFAWWVQGLEAADHIVPRVAEGEALFDALARDETGFLTQLLRPLYNATTDLFKILSILILYVAAEIFGGAFSVHVATSVLASAALVLVLGAFPLWYGRPGDGADKSGEDTITGLAALVLGAGALYLHAFSGLGLHNFGVLFLIAAVAGSTRILNGWAAERPGPINWRSVGGLMLFQGLALYAYKTNLFLLPPATALSILLFSGAGLRRKLVCLGVYILIVAALVVPLAPLMFVEASKPEFAKDSFSATAIVGQILSGGIGAMIAPLGKLGAEWFQMAGELYSVPGLIAGLWGLGLMAWRDKVFLPLSVVISHFAAWCLIPLFAATSLRTYLYVLPFFVLGGAYLLVTVGVELRRAAAELNRDYLTMAGTTVLAAVLLAVHLASQIPGLVSKEKLADFLPRAWAFYFTGQGELRPMVAEIERTLPPDAVLMTWGYGLQFLFRNLKDPATQVFVPPALGALMLRHRSGLLRDHIERRRLSIAAGASVYLLVDHRFDLVDRQTAAHGAGVVLGPEGFAIPGSAKLVEVAHWPLQSSWPGEATLYQLEFEQP